MHRLRVRPRDDAREPTRGAEARDRTRERLLALQATAGNQAVARMLARRVEPYTDPGTPVRVIERTNALYSQIGTLKDTVPVDMLAVLFPSDRSTLWRFQPDELDHVLPAELRPRPRAPTAPPEALNQITPLYHYLNDSSVLGFGEWCFTGSLAVTLWASLLNAQVRKPHDIDVIVRADRLLPVVQDLTQNRGFNYADGEPPRPGARICRLEGPMKLDVISSGMGLGSLDGMVLLWGSRPVVGLEQLRNRKKEILDEIGIDDEEELAKATGDLKTIDALLEHQRASGSL